MCVCASWLLLCVLHTSRPSFLASFIPCVLHCLRSSFLASFIPCVLHSLRPSFLASFIHRVFLSLAPHQRRVHWPIGEFLVQLAAWDGQSWSPTTVSVLLRTSVA